MEKMLDDLEALVAEGLFSEEEARAVAARRRAHEHKLKRRAARVADFRRYAEYERSLARLVERRRVRLGLQGLKRTKADASLTRHCAFVYERAVRKFKADLSLWREYFGFLRQTRSHKALQKVLAKVLALHPTQPGLWLYAAGFEYSVQGNAGGARKLLQRGLRMNAGSAKLWAESFAFELRYADSLRRRRETLGLSMPEEGDEDAGRAALAEVLNGEAAARVARAACGGESKVVDVPALCAELAARLGAEGVATEQPRSAAAVDALLGEHRGDARCAVAAARRAMADAGGEEGEEGGAAALGSLRAAWQAAPSEALFAAAAVELRRLAAMGVLPPGDAAEALTEASVAASEAGCTSEALATESVCARLAAGEALSAQAEAQAAASAGMCSLEALAGCIAAARGEPRDADDDESESESEGDSDDDYDNTPDAGTRAAPVRVGAAADGAASFGKPQAARLAALPALPASEAAWHAAVGHAAASGCPRATARAAEAAGEARLRSAPGTEAAEAADRVFVSSLCALADAAGPRAALAVGEAADRLKRSAPLSRCLASLGARAGLGSQAMEQRLVEAARAGGEGAPEHAWLAAAACAAERGDAAACEKLRVAATRDLAPYAYSSAAFKRKYRDMLL